MFSSRSQIFVPQRLAGIGKSSHHAREHVRNIRALPGLGKMEGVWQKDSLRDPCGWTWLLSLEMLSMVADTPSGRCKPGSQTTLTCAMPLSCLLTARGSHGQFAKYREGQKAKMALRSSIDALALGAATHKNTETEIFGATFCSYPLPVNDLERILCLYTKELRSLQEILLHYTSSVQMHNIQSKLCQNEGP